MNSNNQDVINLFNGTEVRLFNYYKENNIPYTIPDIKARARLANEAFIDALNNGANVVQATEIFNEVLFANLTD